MATREERITAVHPRVHPIDRILRFFSSVKLGITLMMVLIFFSILGTIIVQHNIDRFEKYYASLTPAEKHLFHTLGFFDLYHTWWFNTLLILFSLNLILVSIDIFPKAWRYLTEPKLRATPDFLINQPWYSAHRVLVAEGLKERITALMKAGHLRVKVNGERSYETIFGQRGVWNRFVVFVIHIAVLTILGSAFVGSRWGYEGMVALSPGAVSNELFIRGNEILGIPNTKQVIPFQLACERIRVDLKDPKGPLANQNTINWYTYVHVRDRGEDKAEVIKVNSPLDYGGYRFFQSGPGRPGDASDITLRIKGPEGSSKEVKLDRNIPTRVEGVGEVMFVRFLSDMRVVGGRPQSVSEEYNNPAAELEIRTEQGDRKSTWAFNAQLADFLEKEPSLPAAALGVSGHRFILGDFSKVGQEHVLQVQYDPGVRTVYFGFVLLCSTLIAAFSFSHERVWAVIERRGDDAFLHLGAHTSRNRSAMEKKFNLMAAEIRGWAEPIPVIGRTSSPRAPLEDEGENDTNDSI